MTASLKTLSPMLRMTCACLLAGCGVGLASSLVLAGITLLLAMG